MSRAAGADQIEWVERVELFRGRAAAPTPAPNSEPSPPPNSSAPPSWAWQRKSFGCACGLRGPDVKSAEGAQALRTRWRGPR